MFYLVYKITNNLNQKYYIGCHKTSNIDDGYMGSGKLIKRAIFKYGIENFTKEILHECSTSEEMYLIEHELVIPSSEDINSYNLMEGGKGGFHFINESNQNGSLLAVTKRLELFKDPEWYDNWKSKQVAGCIEYSKSITKDEYTRRGKKANATTKLKTGLYSFEGKCHSEYTKQKIGSKTSITQQGEKNSQYGTMWITNGEFNSKVGKNFILPDGWFLGRKMGLPSIKYAPLV